MEKEKLILEIPFDLHAFATTLSMFLDERGIKENGLFRVLLSKTHTYVQVSDIGATIINFDDEKPYEGNYKDAVDKLLADPKTIGFTSTYAPIVTHLDITGTFIGEGKHITGYRKGERLYHVF